MNEKRKIFPPKYHINLHDATAFIVGEMLTNFLLHSAKLSTSEQVRYPKQPYTFTRAVRRFGETRSTATLLE